MAHKKGQGSSRNGRKNPKKKKKISKYYGT